MGVRGARKAKRVGGLLGLSLTLFLLLPAGGISAEDAAAVPVSRAGWGVTTLDVVVVRPISFLQTAAGSALFVVALPLIIPSGRDGRALAYETFVETPANETFSRELGRF